MTENPSGASSSKRNRPTKDEKNAGKESKKKRTDHEDSSEPTSKPEKPKSDKAKSEKPKSAKPKKAREGKKTEESQKDLAPASTDPKELKAEILAFLQKAKELTEENAKSELRSMVPAYGAKGYDCSLNIYWARRGVQGVGVGVKPKAEDKDIAFFGFKPVCDDWIFAITAAIKAGDIFAPLMQTNIPKKTIVLN